MRILAALLVLGAIAAGAAALWYFEPWSGSEDSPAEIAQEAEDPAGDYSGSACRRMAGVAAKLAEGDQGASAFLRGLGRAAAGIRPGSRAYGDLARGGRNTLPGRGFLARYDDGTAGQARHFAGIATATALGGGAATRVISIFVRDDPAGSPDGRLTDAAIAFANETLTGELEPEDGPRWLLGNLCRRR
ncbi:MAG: hypothetical protein ACXWE8_00315 [Solirubrobacterales bacterium]